MAQSGSVNAQTTQMAQPDQQTFQSVGEIEKLIDDLGSDDFLLRQRSSEKLLEAGSSAVPLLTTAQASHDQEVRYRAADILRKLRDANLEARAKRFLAMPPTSGDDCGFQHWNTFSQLAGVSHEARSLMVAIHSSPQSEELLERIDLHSASVRSFDESKVKPFNDLSVRTSVAVYAAEMYRRSMQPQSAATAQTPLLIGNGIIEELSASAFESNFLSLSPITVQKSEHREAFLTLLTAWLKIELQSNPMTVAKLKIISTHRLRAFARDIVEVLNQPQYPHKQAAIESLGKIFSPADGDDQSTLESGSGVVDAINQLKPFVASNEVLVRLPQAETTGPAEVTLGDFAFQLILNIEEKDPKDFGMSEANGRMLLENKSIFSYKNRDAARESVQKWLANLDESKSSVDR